jgi:hypothetical protein
MTDPRDTLLFEDARIIFRNFEGREGKYNAEGDRNFCVLLDEELAKQLDRDGWNVKALRAREEGDPDQPYLEIKVSYKKRPPKIFMITSRGRTPIMEDMVEILDFADIKTIDFVVNPYEWTVGGKAGIKAYLKTMFVTIHEDALEIKYADLEEVPTRSGRIDE